ncbi:MAG TPA: pyruvate kinase [Syntrophorhabdaceae bacterium]|nr:pyruvate kinase [Syntrophorhabdaceae bacterium]HQK46388.1 pyruvate kinase [Syntrophorhabdaceae bacterium]
MEQRRKARIVCTLGPATSSDRKIKALIESGMDVARLNFSHGDHKSHRDIFARIRRISGRLKKNTAVLQDLQGIKIRVGAVKDGGVHLKKGDIIKIKKGDGISDETTVFISYPWLVDDARPGNRILIDDGLMQLDVEDKKEDYLVAKVVEGGILKDRKGVNLPHMDIRASSFTEKDRADLDFGLELGVDFVAMSFVRKASDVMALKEYMAGKGRKIPIIAKIEKKEAIDDIDNILDVVDGIMIARGDLGVEMPLEEVPLIQKMLIKKANEKMRIVITATQMLESMTQHSRPTRAEATDVANAVIDGTDALMLSAETSAGRYPIEAVKVMDAIITYTEKEMAESISHVSGQSRYLSGDAGSIEAAVARAASQAARDVGARLIVAFTRTGFTARLISKFRPPTPIVAFSPDVSVVRQMSIYHGVQAYFTRNLKNTDDMIKEVNRFLIRTALAKQGDRVILVAGHPASSINRTNLMKVHIVEA